MREFLLAPLLLSAAFLPGCLSEEAGLAPCAYTGSGAKLANSWAYDGVGLVAGNGTLTVDADDETNAGLVRLAVSAGGQNWSMDWTTFAEAPNKTFQDGGIVRELVEHGDSGVGDALIPKVLMHCAGWGTAALVLDGAPFTDPSNGAATVTAHFMVLSEGIRDDSGKITKADGNASYDPEAPSDARTIPGDPEIILLLKSDPAFPAAGPSLVPFGETTPAQMPVYTKRWPLGNVSVGATVNASFSLGGMGPVPTAQLTFRLIDPEEGSPGGTVTLGGPQGPTSGSIVVPSAETAGAWSLGVMGQAVAQEYSGEVNVTAPPPLMMVFHFEELEDCVDPDCPGE